MPVKKMHYRGEIRAKWGRHGMLHVLGNGAVCKDGRRVPGQMTEDRSEVTCAKCLDLLRRHDQLAAEIAARPSKAASVPEREGGTLAPETGEGGAHAPGHGERHA